MSVISSVISAFGSAYRSAYGLWGVSRAVIVTEPEPEPWNPLFSPTVKQTNAVVFNGAQLYFNGKAYVYSAVNEGNLIAWYDASETSSILQSDVSGFVSQINDLSGNDRNLIQDNTDKQPVAVGGNVEGLNTVRFSDNDVLYFDNFPVPTSGDISIFCVARVDLVDDVLDSLFAIDDSGNDFQYASYDTSRFLGRITTANIGTNANPIDWTTTIPVNYNNSPIYHDGHDYVYTFSTLKQGVLIYNTVFDYNGAGTLSAYMGGSLSTEVQSYTTKMNTTAPSFKLFSNRSGSTGPSGVFCEMVVIEDCTEATRQIFEGYLAWKWGMQNDLDISHPYRSSPPTR